MFWKSRGHLEELSFVFQELHNLSQNAAICHMSYFIVVAQESKFLWCWGIKVAVIYFVRVLVSDESVFTQSDLCLLSVELRCWLPPSLQKHCGKGKAHLDNRVTIEESEQKVTLCVGGERFRRWSLGGVIGVCPSWGLWATISFSSFAF